MEANSKKKRKRYSGSDISFNIVNYLIFGLFTLICVYPFYYLIINTISANDLSANGAEGVPSGKLQAGAPAERTWYSRAGFPWKNGDRYGMHSACVCVPWFYVYPGKNVGKKVPVPFYGDYYVL